MCTEGSRSTQRQLFILVAACLISFTGGVMLSFPAVLDPSILSLTSTIYVTPDQVSWIDSSNGFSGILGFLILSPLFQMIGRKYCNLFVAIVLLIGWIIFFFAKTAMDLLFARIIQGIAVGSYYITAISLSEYCDPKRRGYFMSVKKIAQAFGSLACHSLALVTDWRQISALVAIPNILSAVMVLLWPESPAFLAMKGKFSECEKSFVWLNGNSSQKQIELKDLINAQTERLEKNKRSPSRLFFLKSLKKLGRKDFLKPFLIVSLVTVAIDASGRYFLLAYLTRIMKQITGNESIAMYCTVISDFLLICALSTSCFLIRSFKRRTILLTFGTFSTILMFLISFALVLKTHFSIATDVHWLIPSIILMHSFVSHVGLVPIAYAISAEVFPLEHKGFGSFASGIVFTTFYGLSLKLTPIMIERIDVSGTYAIYGICVTICLVLLYIILPETKDKTLQQIEDEMKGVKRTLESDVLINNISGTNRVSNK